MPLLFLGSGLILILTGVIGDPSKLWSLVQGDFTGENNFIYWIVSILVLGGLGYIPQLKNLSRLFIVLIVVVLFLDNKGFFAQLQAFINGTGKPQPQATDSEISSILGTIF